MRIDLFLYITRYIDDLILMSYKFMRVVIISKWLFDDLHFSCSSVCDYQHVLVKLLIKVFNILYVIGYTYIR